MREDDRRRAFKSGKVMLPGGGVIDCTVRDLSAAGAKLRLANASPLPETFELMVSASDVFPVERRWQKGADAGVVFTGPPRHLDPKQR